jgi:hypothetical protein
MKQDEVLFTLHPAKMLDGYGFTIDKSKEPFQVSHRQLMDRFFRRDDPQSRVKFSHLKAGSFLGLSKTGTTFILSNSDRTGNLSFVLKKDRSFPDRIVEVYKVISCGLVSQIMEKLV